LEELSEQEKAKLRQEMEAMRQELNESLEQKAAEKNVLIEKLKDLTIIEIGEEKMFGSGLADLTKQGAGIVKRLVGVLNQYPGYQIRVEGHSDAVPVGASLKATYPSNWELSSARATSVVRYMIYGLKVAPERLSAVGYAHYRPIADNDTEEGKAKNRRIRLVVFKRVAEQ
jgi:chemotaxis protein MotB